MHIDQNYSQYLLQGLNSLRENEELCDVELKSGTTSLFAHRVVLSAMSDYFKAMFTGRMGESVTRTVYIKETDEKSLYLLTNFAYTGNISITTYNVQSLLTTANMLQITKVVDACCDFLMNQLNSSNCLGFLEFADIHSLSKLKESCMTFATDNFLELMKYDEYFYLSCKILKELISSDNLNICSEEIVFTFLERWILFEEESRIKYFPELFKELRSFSLSSGFLTSLKLHNFICSTNCYPLQLELNLTLNTKLNPFRIFNEEIETAKLPRRNSDSIIVIGGKESLTKTLKSCSIYDAANDEWTESVPLEIPHQYGFAASINGITYMVGGSRDNQCSSALLSLSKKSTSWEKLSPMNEQRCSHSVVAFKGLLYVLGGYDGQSCMKSVECYNPKTDQWSLVPSMAYSRCSFAAVVVEDSIYALGGQGTGHLSTVERYDVNKGTWGMVPAMNSKRINFGAVQIHGYIFVVGGHDGKDYLRSMERYDPVTSEWTMVSSMPSARTGLGVAVVRNRIYVLGGHDGTRYLDSSLKYDPLEDSWCRVANMDTPRCYMAIADVWM